MPGNHRVLKIQSPVPSLLSGHKGLQVTVYSPDSSTINVVHADIPEEDYGDLAAWHTAVCAADDDIEDCV